jgi:hypothetical protein
MSNRKNLPKPVRIPPHRHGSGRHRQPARSVGDLVAIPGQAGAKFLAVGVLGSAAMMALPGGAATAATAATVAAGGPASASAGQSPSVSLAADILPGPKSAPAAQQLQSVPLPVPRPADAPGPVTTPPSSVPNAPASTQPTPQDQFGAGAQPIPMYGITPQAPTPPPASNPQPVQVNAPPSLTVSGLFVPPGPTGGPFGSYSTDPTKQTSGYVTFGWLWGEGVGGGIGLTGTPSPGFGVMGMMSMGKDNAFGKYNAYTGDLVGAYSRDTDVAKYGSGPYDQTGMTWGAAVDVPVFNPSQTSITPYGMKWAGAVPGVGGVFVTLPISNDFVSKAGQAISDAAYLEMGMVPPRDPPAAPAAPAPDSPVLTPGGPTLNQMMMPIAPSQGFPDPTAGNANSGPSVQDIIKTFPQVPGTPSAPAGSFPASAPPAAPAPEQHGQADQPGSTGGTVASTAAGDTNVAAGPDNLAPPVTDGGSAGTVTVASADPAANQPAATDPAPAAVGSGGSFQTAGPDQPDNSAPMLPADPTTV